MRIRDCMLIPDKVTADDRSKLIAAALMVDANNFGLREMINFLIETRAAPVEAMQYVLTQKANIQILQDALKLKEMTGMEVVKLHEYLEMINAPHLMDNLVEFCIKVLHGEMPFSVESLDGAIAILKQDKIDEGNAASRLIIPTVMRKQ